MERIKKAVDAFRSERKSLVKDRLAGDSGLRFSQKYSDVMDRFIRELFHSAGFPHYSSDSGMDGLAVVAMGGYGRRELCLASDVDLMVIHQGDLSPAMNQIIRDALYPLWDAKLEVGYSIVTYQECIRLAMGDFRMLTSLMDSRFLLGVRPFYKLFQEAFWSRMAREKGSLLGRFLVSRRERAERNEGEAGFVEPDLKEGLGGLRDIHLMRWMARIWLECEQLGQIKRYAAFSHFEIRKLGISRSFLLKIRNHLHSLAGRREDSLRLSCQDRLSKILGYRDGPQISGPEKLMRDVYLHLNRIRYRHEEFQVKMLDMIDPSPVEPIQKDLPTEFMVRKGNIVLREGVLSEKDPLVILRGLKEANRRGLFLGSGFIWEAREIIARKKKLLSESTYAKALFLDLFLKPENPKVIRLALEIGLVSLFMPEFRKIRNLPQYGFYHVMTVDLHSLRTLDVINEISRGSYDENWPVFRAVFEEINHPERLFLAALLHDIGKGYGDDHCVRGPKMIPAILGRLGFKKPVFQTVAFLVAHHLLMPRVAQRRDLREEKASVQVAQVIQDVQLLRMLFLLSVADSFATGPMARSDWKLMLLAELFHKVRGILDRGILATPDATEKIVRKREKIQKILVQDFETKAVRDMVDQVSSRYVLNTPVSDMVVHFSLALSLGDSPHAWKMEKQKGAAVTRVIQVTHDKPGLFSKMVGVFALNNMMVLSADIFTLKNGLAFDTYEVTNPPDAYRENEKWAKTKYDVDEALADRLLLDQLLQEKKEGQMPGPYERPIKKQVNVNNEESDFFTIIELQAGARFGLLYDLARVMFSMDLDIRTAKVNSDGEKLTGVFYVRDSGGQKLFEPEKIKRTREQLLAALEI